MGSAGEASDGSRIRAVQRWLGSRVDTRLGRLAAQWFRAYFAASRNSGCAATIYSLLSVLPFALVAVAILHPSGTDASAFADRIVDHMNLNGENARLVRDTFGSASSNALAATLTAVVGFLLWGIGIGPIYRDVYARAWRVEVGPAAGQARFAVFFFVVTGAVGLAVVGAAGLRARGWLVLLPVWLVGSTLFWLWVPRFLLHRLIGWRALLPGALLASLVVGGTLATSPLWLAGPLNESGQAFGAFGVVLTLLTLVFIVITISLVCAVFSPVWASWRQSEKLRGGPTTISPG